jgi:hypothetical protein
MIHNNFRKLMRLFSKGSTGSSYKPFIKNLTDVTGYTGVQDNLDWTQGDCLFYSVYTAQYTSHASYGVGSYYTYAQIRADNNGSAGNSGSNFFIMGGQSIDNEPDYSLGNIPDNLRICMVYTSSSSANADVYNYPITGTLQNNSSTSITIDELALFTHCYYNNATAWHGSYKTADFLLIKETLTTPIKLEAGDSISVSFNLFTDEPEIVSVSENS